MIKTVDMSKIKLGGCNESVRKEILAIHDRHLEDGVDTKKLYSDRRDNFAFRYLVLRLKILIRKIKR